MVLPALFVTATNRYDAVVGLSLSSPSGGIWRVAPSGTAPGTPVEVRLRAVGETGPMVVSSLPRGTRAHGDPVGFDAEAGEFLPPWGSGRTADFFVRSATSPIGEVSAGYRRGYSWLEFAPVPGGALLAVPAETDELRSPRKAPEEGWSSDPIRFATSILQSSSDEIFAGFLRKRGAKRKEDVTANETNSKFPQCCSAQMERTVILFRSPRDSGERFGAIIPPLRCHALIPGETSWTVRFNVEPRRRGLEPEPLEPAKRDRPAGNPVAKMSSHSGNRRLATGGESPPAGEALLAAVASDGTAVFFGSEADGAFVPFSFPTAVRFRPGEADRTPLARAKTLVVSDAVQTVPKGVFAGLGSLQCVVLPRDLLSVSSRAFADCPALSNVVFRGYLNPGGRAIVAPDAFARAGGARPAAWLPGADGDRPDDPERPGGPFSRVFGIAARVPSGRANVYVSWRFLEKDPLFIGVRVTDGCLWQRSSDGNPLFLATVDPAAEPPAEIDGEPVSPRRERSGNGLFLWTEAEGGAMLLQCAVTNGVFLLPATLGGLPVAALLPSAFDSAAAKGVRVPRTVKWNNVYTGYDYPETAPHAFWFDDPARRSLSPPVSFAPFPGRSGLYPPVVRRLPASTDVEWLLLRGTNGPPRESGFEFVKRADTPEAVVTAIASRPENGVLAFPPFLGGWPVSEIGESACSPCGGLESVSEVTAAVFGNRAFRDRRRADWNGTPFETPLAVTIPEGVRRIGPSAFACFAPLESISLPASLDSIGADAFADCPLLEEIDLPEGVREVPAGAFKGCRALRRVRAPGVSSIGPFAFAGCTSLETVDIPADCTADRDAFADSRGFLPGRGEPSSPP